MAAVQITKKSIRPLMNAAPGLLWVSYNVMKNNSLCSLFLMLNISQISFLSIILWKLYLLILFFIYCTICNITLIFICCFLLVQLWWNVLLYRNFCRSFSDNKITLLLLNFISVYHISLKVVTLEQATWIIHSIMSVLYLSANYIGWFWKQKLMM